jgi:hypothetical protein
MSAPNRIHRTAACNDNGHFAALRRDLATLPSGLLRVATEVAGQITLRYVADGVLIITAR